jgi:septal ring factor EnvC (AmiA/AmiB activator)
MTREEAIDVLCVKAGKGEFVRDIINQIFDEHETQLKAKDEEIAKYQMAIDKQSKRAEALKQLSLDKDEEIKKLKAEKESLCKTIKDLQTANTHWRIYHKDNQ